MANQIELADQNPPDILESRIAPLLLRSPPPPSTSRSVTPEPDSESGATQPSFIENIHSNFSLDFAFDLNDEGNFDNDSHSLDKDEEDFNFNKLASPIAIDRNLVIDEKPLEFNNNSNNNNNSKSIPNEEPNWAADFNFNEPVNARESKHDRPIGVATRTDANVLPNEPNSSTTFNDDPDDDWADFVDNTKTSSTIPFSIIPIEQVNETLTPRSGDMKTNANQTPKSPFLRNKHDLDEKCHHVNSLDNLVNQLFSSLNVNVKNSLEETDSAKEMFIDDDATWKQLIAYTSVIDASMSLQFKWNLSCLEDNCLNSLNLVRAENSQVIEEHAYAFSY